jgi:CheY-like chemotaxis protein
VNGGLDPSGKVLRLLHLEDDDDDAELTLNVLREAGYACEEKRASGRDQFEATLSEGAEFDVILADYAVPGYDGHAALACARAVRPDIPFILISGKVGEELAIEMLQAGATDYVLKQRMGRLVPAVARALRDKERERVREASERLIHRLSERMVPASLLEVVVAQLPAGVLIAEAPGGEVVLVNPHYEEILGVEPGSLRSLHDLARRLPARTDGVPYRYDDLPPVRALHAGAQVRAELLVFGGPQRRVVVAHAAPVRAPDGSVLAVVTTLSDDTERLELELERARLRDRVAEDARLLEAVAGELRSRLGAIAAAADALPRREVDPRIERSVEALTGSARRIEQVVRELLDRAART